MPRDPLAVIYYASEEVRAASSYFFDNGRRRDANGIVIQRTLAGEGFYRDAAGVKLVPAETAMIFTHREPSRYGYPKDATEPYRFRFLTISPTPGLLGLAKWLRRDFGSVVRLPADSEVGALFDEVYQRFNAQTFRDRIHETELLHRLFFALYREQIVQTRADDPIEFGHHYLKDHFRSPINLKTVAAKVGVSREYFIRTFHARFGESPGAVLRKLRMEHARSMLAITGLSVEEVALASGFTSSNTFCRAYRRTYGGSPGASRGASVNRGR